MFSGIREILASLQIDPSGTLITLAYIAICILFSLILHECAHGWVAYKCGDPTAKMLGRLTLNPVKHLDPIGTICMVFLRVGWAKPVPINPRRFRNYKRDYILVSIAGIVTNLFLCVISLFVAALLCKLVYTQNTLNIIRSMGLCDKLINVYDMDLDSFLQPYARLIYSGYFDSLANVINKDMMWILYLQRLFLMLAQMNLGLAVFNLIPLPPLDGYRFLDMLVFKGKLAIDKNMMYILQMVFFVVCMSGLVGDYILQPLNKAIFSFISSSLALII